jgi:hypothetical protein
MKKILLVPFAILLFSCNSTKKTAESSEKPMTEQKNTSSKMFTVLSESSYQGKESKSYEVIKDSNALAKLYESVNDEMVPKVDFKKERIVALFLGQKNSGGYAVKVKEVSEKGDEIYVTVEEISPKAGENATMAITNPYTIVKINSTKEIVFK